MKRDKTFNEQIKNGAFLVTAEFLPRAETNGKAIRAAVESLKAVPSAVNVSDNPYRVAMSSLAASVMLAREGIEPIYQVVTRDRNRISIQSDLLGACSLGIGTVLCLSGYHQTLTDSAESANVYDIDSIQLVSLVRSMREKGTLLNGAGIDGAFPMVTGAAANPYLKPLELNMIRLAQKVEAGAEFFQTQAVFDTDDFAKWFDAAKDAGVAGKAAIIAGVCPLDSAEEAEHLRATYTEFMIPDAMVERLRSAGDAAAQKKEGRAICLETIRALMKIPGLRGIHILSGGKEECIPEILGEAGLSGNQ